MSEEPNELPFHLKTALENGITKDEIVATMTHLAFYTGWPTAIAVKSLPPCAESRPRRPPR